MASINGPCGGTKDGETLLVTLDTISKIGFQMVSGRGDPAFAALFSEVRG